MALIGAIELKKTSRAASSHAIEVLQTVEMRDAKGSDWTALYTLQRQPDNLWRISGCVLRRGSGKAV